MFRCTYIHEGRYHLYTIKKGLVSPFFIVFVLFIDSRILYFQFVCIRFIHYDTIYIRAITVHNKHEQILWVCVNVPSLEVLNVLPVNITFVYPSLHTIYPNHPLIVYSQSRKLFVRRSLHTFFTLSWRNNLSVVVCNINLYSLYISS